MPLLDMSVGNVKCSEMIAIQTIIHVRSCCGPAQNMPAAATHSESRSVVMPLPFQCLCRASCRASAGSLPGLCRVVAGLPGPGMVSGKASGNDTGKALGEATDEESSSLSPASPSSHSLPSSHAFPSSRSSLSSPSLPLSPSSHLLPSSPSFPSSPWSPLCRASGPRRGLRQGRRQ